jgi:hypothetical protein
MRRLAARARAKTERERFNAIITVLLAQFAALMGILIVLLTKG